MKELFSRIKNKEIKGKRILHYKGKIDSDKKKKTYFLEITAFVCPKTATPLVVVVKDVTAKHKLKEAKTLEKNQQTMISNLVQETNNTMFLAKNVVEVSIQAVYSLLMSKEVPSKDEIKNILVNTTQQILNPLLNFISDLDEFGSPNKTRIKYNFSTWDLKKIIEEVILLFEVQARLQMTTINAIYKRENKLQVHTDKKHLKQLLIRLISNSLKHTQNGAIKIIVTNFNSSINITVEDTGKGIPPALLHALSEELKSYHSDNLKAFHIKARKTQGLPIAQILALGLGPRSAMGLAIKSNINEGTSVSFILENKISDDEVGKSESFTGSPSHLLQRRCFSPTKPSKFKMTHEYESQDITISSDINESVGINIIVNHNLEGGMISKRSGDNSPKRPYNSFNDIGTKNETKKSKFAEHDDQIRYSHENINEV